MFELEQKRIEDQICAYCVDSGLPMPKLQWSWIPFSGHWGISTSFFQLAAQDAREKGAKTNVAESAQAIASGVAAMLGIPEDFERVEAVRGYLNIYFSTAEYTRRVIDLVRTQGDQYGRGVRKTEQVMVEFSQPNTHKAFHVGHLRSAILGDVLARILDAAGYAVIRANYPGDIGKHVIKWLWNYMKFHQGEKPEQDITRWMGDLYLEATKRLEADPELEADIHTMYARWDQRDPEVVSLWEKTRQWSLDGFKEMYELLGISFDKYYFQSEGEESGKQVVAELIARGIAQDERPDGAVIVKLDELLGLKNEKFRVLVVLRSDGTALYATEDLALAIRKFTEYPQLTRSLYVVDVRQSLHFQQVFKTLEIAGYPWAANCQHIPYELVALPGNVAMASREGTVVLLEDLIREATSRALAIVQTKNPELSSERQQEISQAVALGAIRYSMISRENTKVVTFDWESALNFDGQAAPYIQYAYVRAGSILRKWGKALPDSWMPDYELAPAEIQLVELISRLPREIQAAAADYRPMTVSNLAYELAKAFSDFYNQCPVLQAEPAVRDGRLQLVAAAQQTIGNALAVLGVIAPQAM